jgi:hypothetical protein
MCVINAPDLLVGLRLGRGFLGERMGPGDDHCRENEHIRPSSHQPSTATRREQAAPQSIITMFGWRGRRLLHLLLLEKQCNVALFVGLFPNRLQVCRSVLTEEALDFFGIEDGPDATRFG